MDYFQTFLKEIVVIEKKVASKRPEVVAGIYLTNSHDLPTELPKTREYFEKILEETGSIQISHNYRDRFNLAFSTVKILKILKPEEWGSDLQKARYFKNPNIFPKSFTYFDYMVSWEKFIYYQNDRHSHSWFIVFELSKSLKMEDFSAWFQSWFYHWGPSPTTDFMPKQDDQVFEKFYQTYQDLNFNQAFMSFAFAYNIPWILKWSYVIDDHVGTGCYRLLRKMEVKWWNKFDATQIVADISIPDSVRDGEASSSNCSRQKIK